MKRNLLCMTIACIFSISGCVQPRGGMNKIETEQTKQVLMDMIGKCRQRVGGEKTPFFTLLRILGELLDNKQVLSIASIGENLEKAPQHEAEQAKEYAKCLAPISERYKALEATELADALFAVAVKDKGCDNVSLRFPDLRQHTYQGSAGEAIYALSDVDDRPSGALSSQRKFSIEKVVYQDGKEVEQVNFRAVVDVGECHLRHYKMLIVGRKYGGQDWYITGRTLADFEGGQNKYEFPMVSFDLERTNRQENDVSDGVLKHMKDPSESRPYTFGRMHEYQVLFVSNFGEVTDALRPGDRTGTQEPGAKTDDRQKEREIAVNKYLQSGRVVGKNARAIVVENIKNLPPSMIKEKKADKTDKKQSVLFCCSERKK